MRNELDLNRMKDFWQDNYFLRLKVLVFLFLKFESFISQVQYKNYKSNKE